MKTAALSVDTLVYDALQRTYRNAVIRYARHRLIEKLDLELGDEIRALFAKEWDDITRSAEQAAATGATERVITDELDYLGVSHFRVLFEKYWHHLGPSSELAAPGLDRKARNEFLGRLTDIVNIRNPISHPAEEDLPIADAIRSVDTARRVLRMLHLVEAEYRIQEVLDELLRRAASGIGLGSAGERLEAILPPRESVVVDFIGRTQELAELWRWLLDDSSPRWLLSGDGGKGKSAIAYRFAQDVRESAPSWLNIVIWLSAKRRRFEEGEALPISAPDFSDLGTALDCLLRGYAYPELTKGDLKAKQDAVLELLDQLPALLVIDDIDSLSVEHEDAADFFLLHVARTRSKVLLTSRRVYAGMGRSSTTVEGLNLTDAREFMESRLRLLDLTDVRLSDKRVARIHEACEGSPLYVEDLLRLAKFLTIDKAIDAWMSHRGDDVREYALARELELLTDDARRVLEVCSIAPSPATVDEIARSAGFSEDKVIAAIEELRRMYLVPGPQIVEDIPRYQLNRNLAQLVRKHLRESPYYVELQNAVQHVFGRVGRTGADTTVSDVCRQARVFMHAREWERAAELISEALAAKPNHPLLYAMLGAAYAGMRPPMVADARSAFERAFQLRCRDAQMYVAWSRFEDSREDWVRAARAAEAGLEEVDGARVELLQKAGYARSRLARQLRDSFVLDRAVAEARRAEDHLSTAVKLMGVESPRPELMSRVFRAWAINAQLVEHLDVLRPGEPSLCERLGQWLQKCPTDPKALAERERQLSRCPDLAAAAT